MRLWEDFEKIFPKAPFSSRMPSWLWRKSALEFIGGGCDLASYAALLIVPPQGAVAENRVLIVFF